MKCIVIIGIIRKPIVPRDPGPPRIITEEEPSGIHSWSSGGSHLAKSSDIVVVVPYKLA